MRSWTGTTALPGVDPIAYQTAAAHRLVLKQIINALDRLTAGTFGICARCGSAIAAGRLEAIPYVAACVDCQSRAGTG
ncbi:TraR/DksA family transcriptional regulator [Agromyces marinus]|uniref:Zinc finger DksA/TraR C4-type domain-containing protein n=1 Tax=Agromyces marinus TaxID=1389020 RepID=A0ABM8H257_9MICO|nr:hypothetical protein GCM10025870_19530 [Agromyces marinus]